MKLLRNAALAAILLSGAISGPATAATVDIAFTSFSRQDVSGALAQRDAFIGSGQFGRKISNPASRPATERRTTVRPERS